MVNHFWIWLFLVLLFLGTFYALLKRYSRFRSRTLDEVIPLLRRIDHAQIGELFNSFREEETLRSIRNPYRIRRTQRARLDQAREYLRSMVHNTRTVFEWADPEYRCACREPEAFSRQTRQRIDVLCQSCMLFYNCAFITLAEINFWMVVSAIPGLPLRIPGAAGFRQFGNLDLLEAYEQVRNAAAGLALVFGEEHAEAILQAM